jgi:hypothetical protein
MWKFFSRQTRIIQKLILSKIRQFCTATGANQNQVVPWQPTNILWIGRTRLSIIARLFGSESVENLVRNLLKEASNSAMKIVEMMSSKKQSGCFVKFQSVEEAHQAHDAINKTQTGIRSWFVQGEPFVEDLIRREPGAKLKLQFVGGKPLTQEQIFKMFRPYGQMKDIIFSDTGEVKVWYKNIASATAAKNCLHGRRIGDMSLVVHYDTKDKFTFLLDFLRSPRITLPLTGLGLALTTILLINPMRVWFVFQKLTVEQGVELYTREREMSFIWRNETEKEKELRETFKRKPQGAIFFTGPKGSNKTTLLKKLSRGRMFAVRINCADIETTQEFMDAVVKAIGFRPSFNTLNTLLIWFSSFLPNSTVTPPQEAQFNSMMNILREVLRVRATTADEPAWIIFDEFDKFVNLLSAENKDEQHRAHALLKILTNWARTVTSLGYAHVMFVGDHPTTESVLRNTDALRGNLITIHMDDISKEMAHNYLMQQFKEHREALLKQRQAGGGLISNWWKSDDVEDETTKESTSLHIILPSEDEVKEAVELLGGRLSDLERVVTMVKKGISLQKALTIMKDEAKKEIRAKGFGTKFQQQNVFAWTQRQLWRTIKLLVHTPHIPYDRLVFTVFEGNEAALKALAQANILSFVTINHQRMVTAFSPLYLAAFKEICIHEHAFVNGLEQFGKQADIQDLQKQIVEVCQELVHIGQMIYPTDAIKKRKLYLDRKLKVFVLIREKKNVFCRTQRCVLLFLCFRY